MEEEALSLKQQQEQHCECHPEWSEFSFRVSEAAQVLVVDESERVEVLLLQLMFAGSQWHFSGLRKEKSKLIREQDNMEMHSMKERVYRDTYVVWRTEERDHGYCTCES